MALMNLQCYLDEVADAIVTTLNMSGPVLANQPPLLIVYSCPRSVCVLERLLNGSMRIVVMGIRIP
jgi:hypothetical protein